MTDPHYAHVFLVADRSGSMADCREATQDGINEFFNGQKTVPGKVTASLFQFDDHHDTVFEHLPIGDVPAYELVPRGMTALLDAVGFAFTREGEWLASMPEHERPGIVTAVIATDGMENRSTEWKADGADPASRIRALITQQREVYGWEVLFIGANMDAIKVGGGLGIPVSRSMTYNTTATGTASTYGTLSAVGATISSGVAFAGFTDDQRAAAVDQAPDKDAK
jgi:hypothetical protein